MQFAFMVAQVSCETVRSDAFTAIRLSMSLARELVRSNAT
jgi:hypothetical protein